MAELINNEDQVAEPLLAPRDVALLLGVHTRTLASYARDGKIRFTTTPSGHRRFPADAVRAAHEGRWEDAGPLPSDAE